MIAVPGIPNRLPDTSASLDHDGRDAAAVEMPERLAPSWPAMEDYRRRLGIDIH